MHGTHSLLVLTSDASFGQFLRLMFSGCAVFLASDSQEAAEVLRHRSVDLLILSLQSPVPDRIEFVRALRQEGYHFPVLAFVNPPGESVDESLQPFEVVPLPFRVDALRKQVAGLLSGAPLGIKINRG